MPQITIYVDNDVLALVKTAVKSAGVSQSHWVAEAIRLRAKTEWPQSVRDMAGTWPDFPTAEEIRDVDGTDAPREPL